MIDSARAADRNGKRYRPTDSIPTPWWLFRQVEAMWGPLELDVCATDENAKCARWFTPEQNGLVQDWAPSRCWLNPPYSDIAPWCAKARQEARRGAVVVALLPVRTDSAWFHDHIWKQAEMWFFRGRLEFAGERGKAPHASMLVRWSDLGDPDTSE